MVINSPASDMLKRKGNREIFMKVILILVFVFTSLASAEDYFGDKGPSSSDVRFTVDNANKILLDNVNSNPIPYFDTGTQTCYVNNCPQIHCSPCHQSRRQCRTINCEGEKVELWNESCS